MQSALSSGSGVKVLQVAAPCQLQALWHVCGPQRLVLGQHVVSLHQCRLHLGRCAGTLDNDSDEENSVYTWCVFSDINGTHDSA